MTYLSSPFLLMAFSATRQPFAIQPFIFPNSRCSVIRPDNHIYQEIDINQTYDTNYNLRLPSAD
jgi:hypothetical protein